MKSLFAPSERQQILDRLGKLQPGATRQWGKMDPAQMLAHCAAALEVGTGDRVLPHRLIGRILGPFVKSSLLGDKPFSKNSTTDPEFLVSDARLRAREGAARRAREPLRRGRCSGRGRAHALL